MPLVVRERGTRASMLIPPLSSHSDFSPSAKTRERKRSKRAWRICASTVAALTPGPAALAAFFAVSLIASSSERQSR